MKTQILLGLAAAAMLSAQAPDNTKTNQRDRDNGGVTADNQKGNKGDRDLAQKIRQSVVADKGISSYAHNVKIIVQNGQVTLKGPVRSEEEKTAVEQKAVELAGAGHVVNQLDIVEKK